MIVATFAPNGPRRCSGLDVCRYDGASLAAAIGPGFSVVREAAETHVTPWGARQEFFYGVFRRV